MTTLRFRRAVAVATPDPGRPAWCEVDEAPAVGVIRLTMHAAQHETEPAHRVVLASRLVLPLVSGEVSVDVEPGYWLVSEVGISSGRRDSWLILVPDSESVVDDCDLPAIDPTTLDPAAEPEAAWWTALQAVIVEAAQAAASLPSTYVAFERSDTGAPITGGHVVVKVDPTTHDVTDIVWEA